MVNLLLIPVCIIAGILIKKSKLLPPNTYQLINNIIIYITLPALTLFYIPQIDFYLELIYPAIIIWINFIISIIFFILAEKIFNWNKKTTGALILTAGLSNTSFVGFPVLLALFGEEGLKIGVIIDQAGSFLVLSTLGILVALLYAGGKWSGKKMIFNILMYPSFIAFLISIIMLLTDIRHNDITSLIFEIIGKPTIVLALFSVGLQLSFKTDENLWKEMTSGLVYKLILAPLTAFVFFYLILNIYGLTAMVSIIETAMPPMVMGSVLASKYKLNPKLAAMMVGIGIPASAITLFLWYLLI